MPCFCLGKIGYTLFTHPSYSRNAAYPQSAFTSLGGKLQYSNKIFGGGSNTNKLGKKQRQKKQYLEAENSETLGITLAKILTEEGWQISGEHLRLIFLDGGP